MQDLLNRFGNPLTLVLATFVALGLVGAWEYAEETAGLDYYVAWVAADAVKNDNKNYIYDPASVYKLPAQYRNKADEAKDAPRQKQIAAHIKDMYFTATPFLYWVTATVAVGNYEADLTVWHALSLLMLAAFFIVVCRILGYSVTTTLAIFLPLVVWFIPLHSDLRVANVNSFQLGMVGLAMWLQSRASNSKYLFAAGMVIGLIVMFKPNLAPIGLVLAGGWLLRHQYSHLITGVSGMLAGALAAILVSSWWLGTSSAWLDWLKVISGFLGAAPKISGNYSVMQKLTGGLSPAGQLVLTLLLISAALALFWWGRRRQSALSTTPENQSTETQPLEDTLLIAMGCIIALMASSLVWIHYYLLTIPLMLFMLRPWDGKEQGSFTRVLMQRILPVVAIVALMDSAIPRLFEMEGREFRAIAAPLYLMMMFIAGMWQLAYGLEKAPQSHKPDETT
jgi:hypothetical protein